MDLKWIDSLACFRVFAQEKLQPTSNAVKALTGVHGHLLLIFKAALDQLQSFSHPVPFLNAFKNLRDVSLIRNHSFAYLTYRPFTIDYFLQSRQI